jgi:hypothetical protein
MHRNRVAQRMKTPLGLRHGCTPTILLHQIPIRAPFQGDTAGGDKEGGGVVLAGPQLGSEEAEVLRLQGRGFGDGAFAPWGVDAAVLHVHLITLEQRHFGSP